MVLGDIAAMPGVDVAILSAAFAATVRLIACDARLIVNSHLAQSALARALLEFAAQPECITSESLGKAARCLLERPPISSFAACSELRGLLHQVAAANCRNGYERGPTIALLPPPL